MTKLLQPIIIINNIKGLAQHGFSLVELMVTIGVIGILTSIVSVTYSTYNAKSQVTATILLLESYVKKAENYYVEHNTNNDGFSSIDSIASIGGYTKNSTDIINDITVNTTTDHTNKQESLTLTATFNDKAVNALQNKILNLTITASNGSFTTACRSNAKQEYLPSVCEKINY